VPSIQVNIYDQRYRISGELDEAYVQDLARYVDEKMRTVAEATKTVDSVRVAVLAALNIADELHALRDREAGSRAELRKRVTRCVRLVEQALERAG
jgi:cell division protein ZapA